VAGIPGNRLSHYWDDATETIAINILASQPELRDHDSQESIRVLGETSKRVRDDESRMTRRLEIVPEMEPRLFCIGLSRRQLGNRQPDSPDLASPEAHDIQTSRPGPQKRTVDREWRPDEHRRTVGLILVSAQVRRTARKTLAEGSGRLSWDELGGDLALAQEAVAAEGGR